MYIYKIKIFFFLFISFLENVVKKIIRDVSRLKNMREAQNVIDNGLNSVQYLKIRNYRDKESSFTILCPFMEGNDKNIRELERTQISLFIHRIFEYNIK
ncbi:hypothetical protein PFNF54_04430 [Plasmodium falciparum NF54]|uniref:Uncharacterized protein n=1 Tax=Plasmodium falciparum (isolate NF54) TaxID=5843 RepID=W7KB52_PLAFO|nr:hypothetical protein PFNF54_04430 [Plasmodium falciparum NF54]